MIAKNRYPLLALLAIFIMPISLAWTLYHSGLAMQVNNNQGIALYRKSRLLNLVANPEKRWQLLVFADNTEQRTHWLKLADASVVLLREHAPRVEIVSTKAAGITSQRPVQIRSSANDLGKKLAIHATDTLTEPQSGIVLIDPQGTAVTLYTHAQKREALLADLKRLLKYSRIG